MKKKTASSKAPLFIALSFIFVFISACVILAMEMKKELKPIVVPPVESTITPGPVSLEGQMACLPSIPGADGSSTMECTYGFRSDNGHYYEVRDPENENNPEWFQNPLYTAERVRINGTLSGEISGHYDVVGVISVDSFEVLEETGDSVPEEL